MVDESLSATAIAWKVLYNEDFEEIPNPNLPENSARINVERKQRREAISRFVTGQGKPIFDEWRKQIKSKNLALISTPDKLMCLCPACNQIRDIRSRLEMILEAEMVLREQKEDI